MPRIKIPAGVTIFLAIWLGVSLTPPLREVFQAASFNEFQISYVKRPQLQDLLRRYPNNPDVVATLMPEAGPGSARIESGDSPLEARAAAHDDLIRRFPRENWIRAARLNRVMNHAIEVSTLGWTETSNKTNRATLPASIQVALEAQKIEPDNAFFPWMEAIGRVGLGQKEAALKALEKAAKGTRFDNYQDDLTRRRLAVYKLAGPLLYEEKIMVLSSSQASYFEQMHQALAEAVQMAVEARNRGDHKRALEICDVALRAAAVVRNHGGSFRHAILGGGLSRYVIEKMNVANRSIHLEAAGHWSDERRDRTITLSQDFATYARRHGRDDLARRVLAQSQSTNFLIAHRDHDWWEEFWLFPPRPRLATQAVWFSARIAQLAFIGAGVWLLTGALFFVWQRRAPKGVGRPWPSRGEAAFSSAFSFWSIWGFGVLAVMFGVGVEGPERRWLAGLAPASLEQGNILLTRFLPLCALVCWLLPVAFTTWKRFRGTPLQWFGRVLALLAAGQWTLLYCAESALLPVAAVPWITSVPLLSVFALGALGIEAYLITQAVSDWRKERASGIKNAKTYQRFNWLFATRLAGTSAGVLAVSFSMLFLALNFWLWSERADFNRILERRIQLGEEGWLRERMAQLTSG